MDIYTVKPGDTLAGIARRFGTSAEALAALNQLNDPAKLLPNLALLVPGPEPPARPEILVNAYVCPDVSRTVLAETLPALSFLSPFSCRLTADGGLVTLDDAGLAEAALAQDAAPFLTVTNLSESGGFSGGIAHAVFTDPGAQDAATENILAALDRRPYAGVNLYLAYLCPFDRESYSRFLRRLSELLHARGRYLITAVAPKEGDDRQSLPDTACDYAAHGRWADWVVLMTYDWGYSRSAPQAVSPVDRIRRVLDYAVTRMPTGSILLGMSNYGCRWRLPWRQGDGATAVGSAAAANLAVSVGAELHYDSRARAPWFSYTDPRGQRSVLWFEDPRSVKARLALVRDYELAGLSWWGVNRLYRPGLRLQESMFTAMKIL